MAPRKKPMTPLQRLIEAAKESNEVACAETCAHHFPTPVHTSECNRANAAITAAQAYEQAIRDMENEIEKFKEGRKAIRCAWCGWATEKIEDTTERWAAMEDHARVCEKAPYARMLEEMTALLEGAAKQFESQKLAESQMQAIREQLSTPMPIQEFLSPTEGQQFNDGIYYYRKSAIDAREAKLRDLLKSEGL